MVLSFNFVINIYYNGNLRDYIFGGFCSGLAIATKYNVGLILLPLIIGHFFYLRHNRVNNNREITLAIFFCCIAFFIFCPWILFDFKNFSADFIKQAYYSKAPWFGASFENSYVQYLKVVAWGYGIIPSGFLLLGIAVLWGDKEKLILVGSFPFVYFSLMGLSKLFFVRFALPIIPYLCLISGYGIVTASIFFTQKRQHIIIIGFLLSAVLQGMVFSIKHNLLIGKQDTRVIVREWMINNIAPNSTIISEAYGPSLRNFDNRGIINNYQIQSVGKALPKKTLEDYKKDGIKYIITSDFIRMRYYSFPKNYSNEIRFYGSLDESGREIYSISPAKRPVPFHVDEVYSPFWNLFVLDRPGPQIRVYQLF
jgi:hypothetical protein